MFKFNKISFAVLLVFGLIATYLFQTYGQLKSSSSLVSSGFSLPLEWSGKKDPLIKLNRLSRTLYYIDSAYVDPARVDPKAMFKSLLTDLSSGIPEVQALFPNQDMALVSVNGSKREFSLHQNGLASLLSSTSEVLRFVRSQQVSRLSNENLESYALDSILNTLDPHSIYMPKELYKQTLVDTSGEFGGLGIVIGFRDKKLSIISPIEDTPAYRAGLKSGDLIVKIEDESTDGMLLRGAVERMRGPKGTKVSITVMREGWEAPKDFSLTRAKIQIVSVESVLLPKKVAYVRLKNFQQDTAESLIKHLDDLKKQAKGSFSALILDLRGNPGGILDQAVAVSDVFLDKGVIVSTVGFNNRINQKEEAKSSNTQPNYPMAILIDEGSASASEIVAGALKNRAVLIGRKSFGKGSVQRLFDLPDDSALKLTIAQYLARGDVSIQSIGISPDVETQAKIISKKGFNLFPSDEAYGEASLERHLETKKDKTPKDFFTKPSFQMSFLEELDEEGISLRAQSLGDSSESRMKKINQDFEISVAKTLLLGAKTASKKKILEQAPKLLEEMRSEQEQILTQSLKDKMVDWSSRNISNCAPSIEVKTQFSGDKTITAGEKRQLSVSVQNTGKCDIYRLWAELDSKAYYLDMRELIFGKLAPGKKLVRQIEVEFPKGSPEALLDTNLVFKYAQSEPNENLYEKSFLTRVVASKIPELNYTLSFKDKNNNGVAESEEELIIKVDVQNLGIETSDEASVNLKSSDSDIIEIVKGHQSLKKLGSGKSKRLEFVALVKDFKKDDEAKLTLQFTDYEFQKVSSYPIVLSQKLKRKQTLIAPVVNISNTTDMLKQPIKNKFLKIKGLFNDDESVIDYFIMVNEKKVHYSKFKDLKKSQSFEAEVPLEPGRNVIVIAVRDKGYVLGAEKIILQRASDF